MKTSPLHRTTPGRLAPARAVALVIVLFFVVLLTVVVVAFLSHSQVAERINNARSAQSQVDILSREVVEFTKSDLRQEIVAGSRGASTDGSTYYTVNSVPIYVPLANTTVLPSRTGFTPGTVGSDPLDNIVKISKSGTSFFPAAAPYYPAAYPPSNFASAVGTATPSLNGRYIDSSAGWTTTGWDRPQLVDTVRYPTALQSMPLPDWIYVVTPSANAPQVRQVLTAPAANVVGRYSYVIYDEGGLLDINVAGYPSSLSSADARDPSRKGPLALADLTQIPGNITSSMRDALVAWRNQATSAAATFSSQTYPTTSAPSYLKYLLTGNLNLGFDAIYPGDQKLFCRQDLLAYSAANPTILPTQSLAYLATFTRGLNAPTWTPTTTPANTTGCTVDYTKYAENLTSVSSPYTYNVNSINIRWPATVKITRPQLNADVSPSATIVPTETITFNQGDPVIAHRFPLSKISLLSNPAAQTAGAASVVGSVAWAVQYYFGLTWVTSDTILAEPHWEYAHQASGTLASATSINSIHEVATLGVPREPDFFEMLHQGILHGAAQDIMLLDIGASIIDQFDADDVPTAITNGSGGSYREAFGKENLPYLSELLEWPYRPKSDPTRATFEAYVVPVLWNPHRNASIASPTVHNIRLVMTSDSSTLLATISGTAAAGGAVSYSTSGLKSPGSLPFTTGSSATYQESTILTGGNASPAGGTGINDVTNRSGIYLGDVIAADKNATIAAGGSGVGLPTLTKAAISGTADCVLQCQGPDGAWHTYENVSVSAPGGLYPWSTVDSAGAKSGSTTLTAAPSFAGAGAAAYYGVWSEGPVDPRISAGANLPPGGNTSGGSGGIAHMTLASASLGMAGTGGSWQPVAPETPATGISGQDKFSAQFGCFPESPISTVLTHDDNPNMYLGMWNQNDQSSSGYTYYADHDTISSTLAGDTVQRPGDGTYGANPLGSGNINDRPIILNRPFRSVGELGYAFRGAEWRTIDFSSGVSADAGLLDLFSIGDSQQLSQPSTGVYNSTALEAGVVNINTRHPEVLQSLISGSLKNDLDTTASNVISASQATTIAQAIVTETSTGGGPLVNRADIVNRLMNLSPVKSTFTAASPQTVAKPEREAIVRALGEPADTRTWNLLIDLDVQAGRYPSGVVAAGAASGLPRFDVQGEHRYWLHLALDRYTGKVIDEQLEVVHAD